MTVDQPAVRDHRACFFFPFAFAGGHLARIARQVEEAAIDTLESKAWFPPAARRDHAAAPDTARGEATRQPRPAERRLWQAKQGPYSPDLHPYVREILGASAEESRASEPTVRVFELTADGRNVLSGEFGRRGDGLLLALSPRAAMRLGSAELGCMIADASLYLFNTGIGLLVLVAGYAAAPLSAAAVVEANYALSHARARRENLRWRTGAADGAAFSLSDVVQGLLERAGETVPLGWHRLTHLTAVSLASPMTGSSRELALRLARGYTSDYRVDAAIDGAEHVQPVRNVRHAMALEGAAVVVEEDAQAEDVEFLRNYIASVVAPAYLPLAVTALHELHFLLRLKQSAARYVRFDRPDAVLHAGLARRRDELLSFRLYYRFSHASLISTHNAVYLAWRRALDLDRILAEVTQDVVEVERHLGVAIQHGVERRLSLITRMGAAGIAFIAAVPISERLLSTGLALGERLAGAAESDATKEPWWLGIAAIGVGIAAAAVAWYKTGRLKAHEHGSHLHHLIEEPRRPRRG